MSMIMAKKVNENGYIDILNLRNKYPKLCYESMKVLIFVNRIFNQEFKVVNTPKISIEAPIIIEKIGEYITNYRLDLSGIWLKYGVPKEYFIEAIASNFIIRIKEDGKTLMVPIFPNEIVSDCDYEIEKRIKEEVETLQKVGESYEIIGKLYYKGLIEIAEDLREGLIRTEKNDIDGSIKFFRKVVEGFGSWVNADTIKSPNRVEAINKFLKKSFHLLSNFGEHAGTGASINEAVLSKELTVSIAKYLIAKSEE